MARRCDCQMVLDMLEQDPRVRMLGLAARMLWLELLRAIRRTGGASLRFGSVIPDARSIALLVASSVTEVETELQPILACGLLERDADGALRSPALAAAVSRSEINRANALKAGEAHRRRAADRRQLSLPPMGMPAAATEPEPKAPPADEQLSLAKAKELTAKLAVSDDAFRAAGEAAWEAAGFDPARSVVNYGIVRQWMADGADQALIVETIGAVMARGARPSHLGYFSKAIAAALRQPKAIGELPESSRRFTEATKEWWRGGCIGDQPAPADFRPGGKFAVAA